MYLCLASFSVLLRPTGALLWAPLVLFQFYYMKGKYATVLKALILVGYVQQHSIIIMMALS